MQIPTHLGHWGMWHWCYSFHGWTCFFLWRWVFEWNDPTYWPQKLVFPWQLASLYVSCHFQLCKAGSTTEHIHEATLLFIHRCHSPSVRKNGKLHGFGEVLVRTCCTKYTSAQTCPSLNTVNNEYHPRYFSGMVELGYPLSNLLVQGMGLLLLLKDVGVFLMM